MKPIAILSLVALLYGCTSSSETAERNTLTTTVGQYDPPPSGLKRTKIGVPPFKVEKTSHPKKDALATDAADQLNTLWYKTDRFEVIERTLLEQLLKEQGLEGIVDPEELAQPGRVRGIDYMCIGKITNFRVKDERAAKGVNILVAGWKTEDIKVTVEVGVDLRLVNPTTGSLLWANFSEYKRTDSLGALGITILGIAGPQADADLEVDETSHGLLLRLALDDAIKTGLRDLDRKLMEKQK